jgi:Phytanoyl-CoA dioxygenase (PhyH)
MAEKGRKIVLFRAWLDGALHSVKFFVGLIVYLISGNTPAFAYQSMVNLFCLTKGFSNDLISKVITLFDPPFQISNANGFLGDMSNNAHLGLVSSFLNEHGYYVFMNRLSDELCDRLLQFAANNNCSIRPMDGHVEKGILVTKYNRNTPNAVRYDFDTQDLLSNQDVQKIIADLSFVAVAQEYLKTKPVIDVLSMWWHTAYSNKPDMEAAQYFHFDMDRPKWLKFFIYLTDVETTNGPHAFVAGSHKTGGIPKALLKKGYARLTDEEVKAHYSNNDIIEFVAPRGTIIAEDTRGLHKGKHVQSGDRLVLQIQFSNSLFGGYYPKVKMGSELCFELKNTMKQYPDLFSAYL